MEHPLHFNSVSDILCGLSGYRGLPLNGQPGLSSLCQVSVPIKPLSKTVDSLRHHLQGCSSDVEHNPESE